MVILVNKRRDVKNIAALAALGISSAAFEALYESGYLGNEIVRNVPLTPFALGSDAPVVATVAGNRIIEIYGAITAPGPGNAVIALADAATKQYDLYGFTQTEIFVSHGVNQVSAALQFNPITAQLADGVKVTLLGANPLTNSATLAFQAPANPEMQAIAGAAAIVGLISADYLLHHNWNALKNALRKKDEKYPEAPSGPEKKGRLIGNKIAGAMSLASMAALYAEYAIGENGGYFGNEITKTVPLVSKFVGVSQAPVVGTVAGHKIIEIVGTNTDPNFAGNVQIVLADAATKTGIFSLTDRTAILLTRGDTPFSYFNGFNLTTGLLSDGVRGTVLAADPAKNTATVALQASISPETMLIVGATAAALIVSVDYLVHHNWKSIKKKFKDAWHELVKDPGEAAALSKRA